MLNKIFKNGIRFKCQGSSNCCVSRGSYGYVYLSKKDLIKIAKYLNVPFASKEFAKSNGAKWDKDKKKWYYTEDLPKEKKDKLNETFG